MSISSSALIISSDTTLWDNISLAHYRTVAGSLPEHCLLNHEICINVGKSVLLERVIDGRSKIIRSAPSQVSFYQANTSQSFIWDSEAEFLLLYLKPSLPEL